MRLLTFVLALGASLFASLGSESSLCTSAFGGQENLESSTRLDNSVFSDNPFSKPSPPKKKKRTYQEEEAQIPSQPSAPPALKERAAPDSFRCERHFLYQGKQMNVDSDVGRDGLGLLEIVRTVPGALSEVKQYQENRNKIRMASYVSTLGIAAIIAGLFISHPPIDAKTGALRPGGISILTGVILTGTSIAVSFTTSHANDNHLHEAARIYNSVHPDQPIQLQISTKFTF
jgi:hypothetical protein